ncbi:hypothetical protein GR212_27065 [Rhizobium lusitanum]|uniref:Uncharacterized protein n=1 Tax=Rhizobium lusitanum TaxID=293958 RepID=A0A6L9UH40_9HYPH|nr:hypothetical protein [Rhizobium lusitanum]
MFQHGRYFALLANADLVVVSPGKIKPSDGRSFKSSNCGNRGSLPASIHSENDKRGKGGGTGFGIRSEAQIFCFLDPLTLREFRRAGADETAEQPVEL